MDILITKKASFFHKVVYVDHILTIGYSLNLIQTDATRKSSLSLIHDAYNIDLAVRYDEAKNVTSAHTAFKIML